MSDLERVEATRLRPGDILYACETLCALDDTERHDDHMLLVTNCRRFLVPNGTHFRRVIGNRRINMRPDLGARHGTRGTGTQTPENITRRVKNGYAR
jgi:hypothetical protein